MHVPAGQLRDWNSFRPCLGCPLTARQDAAASVTKMAAYKSKGGYDQDAERETLLESLLPAPDRPHSTSRAIALAIVALFLCLVLWMAATADTIADAADRASQDAQARAASWIHSQYIVSPPADGKLQAESSSNSTDTGSNEGTTTQTENTHPSPEDTLDEPTASDIQDWKDHTDLAGLSRYLWHGDLDWDADGNGRLIIVGDVHGMGKVLK